MNVQEYEKMYNLENYYWWFQGRKKIILNLLKKFTRNLNTNTTVLDVGCGTGLILEALNSFCRPVGIDFSRKALSYCQNRNLNSLLLADVDHLPIASQSCDILLALDLLEHIPDDHKLLRDFFRILKPGGFLLVTVPAHQFLWSEHDEALNHFRRYSFNQILRLVRSAGFEVQKSSYAISFVFLPIVIFRLLQRIFKKSDKPKTHLIRLPYTANKLLILLLYLEAFIIKFVKLPFGVSIICVARKIK